MKSFFFILLGMLSIRVATAQKQLVIADSAMVNSFLKRLPNKLEKYELKDLRTASDSFNVRIWESHEIYTLNHSKTTDVTHKIYTTASDSLFSETTIFSDSIASAVLEKLSSANLFDLAPDTYRAIDGRYVFIEIATQKKYAIYSYWSPDPKRNASCKTVVDILRFLDKILDTSSIRIEFLNALPPDNYRWGMSVLHIDKLLDDSVEKTDFYVEMISEMEKKLGISDSTKFNKFPLIVIDSIPAKIHELNKYTKSDIANHTILDKRTAPAIYGQSAQYGCILIETKSAQ